jgi:hypothetical protein
MSALLVSLAIPAFADDDSLPGVPPDQDSSAPPVDPAQGQSYSVDCYLGNPQDGRNLGSLTVTSVTEAGPACNSTYYDCHDGCYGCITGGESICLDRFGSKYQR